MFLVTACGFADASPRTDEGGSPSQITGSPWPHRRSTPEPVAGKNHNVRIVDRTPNFAKGTAERALIQFAPVQVTIHLNDTVTWTNETAYRCRLESVNDQLPDGSGSNSIPAGNNYTIKFTREFMTEASTPMFTYACEEFSASQGVIFVE
jgi:plastocyanin